MFSVNFDNIYDPVC